MRSSSRFPKNLEQRLFDLTLALYRVTDFFPPGEALRKHLREKANEIFSQVLEYNYVEDPENAILKILGKIQSIKGYLGIAKSLRVVKSINLTILEREYIFLADFFAKPSTTTSASESLNPTSPIRSQPQEEAALPFSAERTSNEASEISSTPNSVDLTTNFKPKDEVALPENAVTKKDKDKLSSWQEFSGGNPDSPSLRDEPPAPAGARLAPEGRRSIRLGGPPLLNERQEAILEHLKQAQQAKVSDFYSFFSNISSKTIQRDLQSLVAKNLLKKEGEKRWTVYTLNNLNVQPR